MTIIIVVTGELLRCRAGATAGWAGGIRIFRGAGAGGAGGAGSGAGGSTAGAAAGDEGAGSGGSG
ncbi:hypothetical protein, partial [Kitasatospora sp. DSM 101779]|uniref:hypothetical protein n=1 Tax=Kitasatospora sp. DSM 101779 TaxID=2853165 RepID=UPI0021D8ACD9